MITFLTTKRCTLPPASLDKNRSRAGRSHLWAIPFLGLFAILGGCTSTEEDLCDYYCECEGCSNSEYNACVYGYEDDSYFADRRGCLDYYDDWIACQDDTGRCRGSNWETNCSVESNRLNNCL